MYNLGIRGELLEWFRNYLTDRQQRVVINGQGSDWGDITAGVPQGSVLGPLLFLIYINDLPQSVLNKIKIFADDTTLLVPFSDPQPAAESINNDMSALARWGYTWRVDFNPSKTESLLVTQKRDPPLQPNILFNDTIVECKKFHKHLGLTLSSDLTWGLHINDILERAGKRLDILRGLKWKLDRKTLEILYKSYIRPILEYGDIIWLNCSDREKLDLEKFQLQAIRVITGCTMSTSTANLYLESQFETLEERRTKHSLILFFKIVNGLTGATLRNLLPQQVSQRTSYNLRNRNDYSLDFARIESHFHSFFPATIRHWNALSIDTRNSRTVSIFKRKLNNHVTVVKPYYYVGNRNNVIHHTRIRNNCSNLKSHLYSNHVSDSPLCNCGQTDETPYHYFFECVRHVRHRQKLELALRNFNINTQLLLFGDFNLSYTENVTIFKAAQEYIHDTKRFDPP